MVCDQFATVVAIQIEVGVGGQADCKVAGVIDGRSGQGQCVANCGLWNVLFWVARSRRGSITDRARQVSYVQCDWLGLHELTVTLNNIIYLKLS